MKHGRLIDADALKELLQAWKCVAQERGAEINNMFASAIIAQVDAMPTIEPQRKTGKWIEQDDGWDGVYYECSCCKEAFTLIDGTPSDNLYNYCPNCGADMRTR